MQRIAAEYVRESASLDGGSAIYDNAQGPEKAGRPAGSGVPSATGQPRPAVCRPGAGQPEAEEGRHHLRLEGAITAQTEGASKGQIDYDLTWVKTVNAYIAGFATFSKQMMKSLPFIEQTLTRMMLRDFFKAENASFFGTVSGVANGSTTVSATDDVEEIIQLIGNQKTANFNASYALVSPAQMARLIISTYNKGYYAGAGAVILNGAGGLTIFGTPVFEASPQGPHPARAPSGAAGSGPSALPHGQLPRSERFTEAFNALSPELITLLAAHGVGIAFLETSDWVISETTTLILLKLVNC